jgi:hypothetical protein
MTIRPNALLFAALAAFGFIVPSCVTEVQTDGRTGYASTGSYSNYTVAMADGYAGRGYYYGPPNTRYYERQPGVTYYSTRESVPQQYWSSSRSYDSGRRSDGYDSGRHGDSYRREVRTTTTTSPTTGYTVTMGDGYAGRGYYYGPPNTRYYEQTPGVTYYRTRESVPSQYWSGSTTTVIRN